MSDHQDREKFLFLVDLEESNYPKHFCCGCSLKCGVIFMSIMLILSGVMNILDSFTTSHVFTFFFSAGIGILNVLSGSYLFASTGNYREDLASKGHFYYVILFYLDLLWSVLGLLYLIFFKSHTDLDKQFNFVGVLFAYLLAFVIYFALKIYFMLIIYSYYMYVKKREIRIIENQYNQVSQAEVQHV